MLYRAVKHCWEQGWLESTQRNIIININISNIVYWGYIGIMENKMETTIVGLYRDYYIKLFVSSKAGRVLSTHS